MVTALGDDALVSMILLSTMNCVNGMHGTAAGRFAQAGKYL